MSHREQQTDRLDMNLNGISSEMEQSKIDTFELGCFFLCERTNKTFPLAIVIPKEETTI